MTSSSTNMGSEMAGTFFGCPSGAHFKVFPSHYPPRHKGYFYDRCPPATAEPLKALNTLQPVWHQMNLIQSKGFRDVTHLLGCFTTDLRQAVMAPPISLLTHHLSQLIHLGPHSACHTNLGEMFNQIVHVHGNFTVMAANHESPIQ